MCQACDRARRTDWRFRLRLPEAFGFQIGLAVYQTVYQIGLVGNTLHGGIRIRTVASEFRTMRLSVRKGFMRAPPLHV